MPSTSYQNLKRFTNWRFPAQQSPAQSPTYQSGPRPGSATIPSPSPGPVFIPGPVDPPMRNFNPQQMYQGQNNDPGPSQDETRWSEKQAMPGPNIEEKFKHMLAIIGMGSGPSFGWGRGKSMPNLGGNFRSGGLGSLSLGGGRRGFEPYPQDKLRKRSKYGSSNAQSTQDRLLARYLGGGQ